MRLSRVPAVVALVLGGVLAPLAPAVRSAEPASVLVVVDGVQPRYASIAGGGAGTATAACHVTVTEGTSAKDVLDTVAGYRCISSWQAHVAIRGMQVLCVDGICASSVTLAATEWLCTFNAAVCSDLREIHVRNGDVLTLTYAVVDV